MPHETSGGSSHPLAKQDFVVSRAPMTTALEFGAQHPPCSHAERCHLVMTALSHLPFLELPFLALVLLWAVTSPCKPLESIWAEYLWAF